MDSGLDPILTTKVALKGRNPLSLSLHEIFLMGPTNTWGARQDEPYYHRGHAPYTSQGMTPTRRTFIMYLNTVNIIDADPNNPQDPVFSITFEEVFKRFYVDIEGRADNLREEVAGKLGFKLIQVTYSLEAE